MRTNVMMLAAVVLVSSASAGAGTALAAPVVTASAKHVCHTPVPSGDTYHVIPKGDALLSWSNRHADGLGNVMSATIQCGPGIQSRVLFDYIDAGNMRARLKAAIGVWTPYFQK